jgi:hypothetical protein
MGTVIGPLGPGFELTDGLGQVGVQTCRLLVEHFDRRTVASGTRPGRHQLVDGRHHTPQFGGHLEMHFGARGGRFHGATFAGGCDT